MDSLNATLRCCSCSRLPLLLFPPALLAGALPLIAIVGRGHVGVELDGVAQESLGFDAEHFYPRAERDYPGDDALV